MPNLRRHRPIACAVIAALVVAIVLMVSGIATADDSSTPTDPTTTTPAASTAPSSDASPDAATPDTSDAAPADTSTPVDPAAASTTQAPISVGQDTTVDNSQTAVGNTGANTGVNTAVGDDTPTPTDGGEGTPAAAVSSGAATATGGATQDSITQEASAVATQAAHIVITQLALIVNIGLAAANSGADVATAGSDGAGVSLISTGDASVTGLAGSTAVTQVVDLLDAPEHTDQTAAVTNVGVGVGNTGANLAVGQMSGVAPDGSAVAVSWGPSDSSSIGSGDATAVGDATHTTIVQVAMGTAADDGTLHITQRAVVVNFGAAIANTGFDLSGGSDPDATALLVRGIVLALLTMLQPDAPTTTVPASAASGGGGVAAIRTGTGVAVGDSSTTSIHQLAVGSVTGNHAASADQTATVGNFGFAFANTGANAAGSALPVEVQAQLASIPAAFSGFLNLLAAPGAEAAWSADLQLGAELLAASASVTAVQSLFDLPGGADGAAAQVVVRQITGILNLMISVAVSGKNDVSTVSDAASTGSVTTQAQATDHGAARAVVRTGDADVANVQTTTICQVIDVSPSVCLPPTPAQPSPPIASVLPAAAVVPVAAVGAEAATPAGQLAFTGTNSLLPEGAAGVLVVSAGLVLVVVARRRRRVVRP